MVRAFWVLNHQSVMDWAALRSRTKAWTCLPRVSWSGIRCLRQERDSRLNSISAMFNQLPCFGVYWILP